MLDRRKRAAGNLIYYECKTTLLKIHGPRPDASFKKAQTMVMVGTPSETAKRLVELICKQPKPLTSCCCGVAVSSLWRDLLPRRCALPSPPSTW